MEGHCSTGQSPQWDVVPMEEEEHLLNTNHDSLMPFPPASCHFFLGPTTIPSGYPNTYISTTGFPPQQLLVLNCCGVLLSVASRKFQPTVSLPSSHYENSCYVVSSTTSNQYTRLRVCRTILAGLQYKGRRACGSLCTTLAPSRFVSRSTWTPARSKWHNFLIPSLYRFSNDLFDSVWFPVKMKRVCSYKD